MRITAALLATFGLIVLAGCTGNGKQAGGSGFVEATDVIVSAETGGRITARNFDDGTVIKLGDTLAIIDPSRLELDLASANAARQASVANLEASRLAVTRAREAEAYTTTERARIERLVKAGSATQRQLDQLEHERAQSVIARQSAEANVAVIEAQISKQDADIDRLKRTLQDCHPVSPASGVVTEKYVELGELVAPGKALVKISRLDTVTVKVYLPSGEFSGVKVGDHAKVSTESGETAYDGDVIWTSQEAEFTPKNVQTEKSRANLVFAVKVRIANNDGKLKSGMPVFVTLGNS
ncbi:MAG: HlyD family efflux transporter periplasmic adaptor subunit [Candidatus Zixiibacteriota bacterium]